MADPVCDTFQAKFVSSLNDEALTSEQLMRAVTPKPIDEVRRRRVGDTPVQRFETYEHR